MIYPSWSEMAEILQGLKLLFQPLHEKLKRNFPRGSRGKKMCVCPSLCLSVHLWPLQSEITFDPIVRLWSNFQGQLNSLQVIFGQVVWIPQPSGSGPGPEKGLFLQIFLLPGFWGRGVVSYLFGNGRTRQTKCWERNFDFWPTAQENGAERQGWPGGRQKFWNFNIFYKRDPY